MNWAWAGSIDQLWRQPGFPIWVAIAAAGLFGLVLLVALLRAEKSVANAALALIAVLALGAAATALLRTGPSETLVAHGPAISETAGLSQPALACLDDLAGDTVLSACEKLLFGAPDTVAAAVSSTASRINRVLAAGEVANRPVSPDLERLRAALERDRYGLVAYVLATRHRCRPGECAAYAALTDHNQIAANMEERVYEAQVARYAPGWGGGPQPAATATPPLAALPGASPLAGLPASVPTGKPTNAEFPTSASIPPVTIMTPEPPAAPQPAPKPAVAAKQAPAANHPASSASSTATSPPGAANAQVAVRPAPPPKKPPAPPKPKPVAAPPVQLAPAPASAEE